MSRRSRAAAAALIAFTACAGPPPPLAGPGRTSGPTSPAALDSPSPLPADLVAKRSCPYTRHLIDGLESFGRMTGTSPDCAMVFNDASPKWSQWENPWFITHADANRNWATWHKAVPGRQLVITQSMIPDEVPEDWRTRGAAGEYDEHARRLAGNLVEAGLGSTIIRLGHEPNGTWFKHSLGNDPGAWKEYWRRIVLAMRSVPGAGFRFDWCIHAGDEPIPFDKYYPGDDVVDIVGMDLYDDLPPSEPARTPEERWEKVMGKPWGGSDLVTFARARNKPLSIPEWAVVAKGRKPGAGDNPQFVNGVASIVAGNQVAYHAYFESPTMGVGLTLRQAPRSLEAYRAAFG